MPSLDLVTKEQQFYVYSQVVKTVRFLINEKSESLLGLLAKIKCK